MIIGILMIMIIHYICRGNVLRSLIAESYTASLLIKDIEVLSSGTIANWQDPMEQKYFASTIALLKRHKIAAYAKSRQDRLSKERLNAKVDVTVFMNKIVVEEALEIDTLPNSRINWNITDIGENGRTDMSQREKYEEEIYQEIVSHVNNLLVDYKPRLGTVY